MQINYNLSIPNVHFEYRRGSWLKFIFHERLKILSLQSLDLLTINFCNCSFLSPFHVVSLGCLIETVKEKFNCTLEFSCIKNKLSKYIEDIMLKEYWDVGFDRNYYMNPKITTNFNLWRISHSMIDNYVHRARSYFESNYFNHNDLSLLSISLQELFNNIIDHSESPIDGFTLTQYYPNIDTIRLSVCDFGMGIPTNVNNYLRSSLQQKEDVKSWDALAQSFDIGFSSKSTPRNRGYGLDTIKSIIYENKGKLYVLSNDGMIIIYNNEITKYRLNFNFEGTIFDIELNTKNLEDKDDYLYDVTF
jgi:hypothetical protein